MLVSALFDVENKTIIFYDSKVRQIKTTVDSPIDNDNVEAYFDSLKPIFYSFIAKDSAYIFLDDNVGSEKRKQFLESSKNHGFANAKIASATTLFFIKTASSFIENFKDGDAIWIFDKSTKFQIWQKNANKFAVIQWYSGKITQDEIFGISDGILQHFQNTLHVFGCNFIIENFIKKAFVGISFEIHRKIPELDWNKVIHNCLIPNFEYENGICLSQKKLILKANNKIVYCHENKNDEKIYLPYERIFKVETNLPTVLLQLLENDKVIMQENISTSFHRVILIIDINGIASFRYGKLEETTPTTILHEESKIPPTPDPPKSLAENPCQKQKGSTALISQLSKHFENMSKSREQNMPSNYSIPPIPANNYSVPPISNVKVPPPLPAKPEALKAEPKRAVPPRPRHLFNNVDDNLPPPPPIRFQNAERTVTLRMPKYDDIPHPPTAFGPRHFLRIANENPTPQFRFQNAVKLFPPQVPKIDEIPHPPTAFAKCRGRDALVSHPRHFSKTVDFLPPFRLQNATRHSEVPKFDDETPHPPTAFVPQPQHFSKTVDSPFRLQNADKKRHPQMPNDDPHPMASDIPADPMPSNPPSSKSFTLPPKISTFNSAIKAVGIDLGTSRCCVAVSRAYAFETVGIENNGDRLMPSYVSFAESSPQCGKIVVDRLKNASKSTIFDSKRLIGREFEYIDHDPIWPFRLKNVGNMVGMEIIVEKNAVTKMPEEISEILLRHIKKKVEEFQAGTLSDAVITVPSSFTEAQKAATMEAGRRAGWSPILLPEPIAASFAYFNNHEYLCSSPILCFDLGGGTLDICLFKIDNRQISIIKEAGDNFLGGRDFDSLIFNFFLDKLEDHFGIEISGNEKKKYKLLEECQKIKLSLSVREEDRLDVDDFSHENGNTICITRKWFEDKSKQLLYKIQTFISTILKESGYRTTDISKILLVGGGCRMPMIKNLLAKKFEQAELCCHEQPEEVVAIGAAMYSYYLSTKTSN